jgi:pimeloyl-ACP methyl ester carboxylesterase
MPSSAEQFARGVDADALPLPERPVRLRLAEGERSVDLLLARGRTPRLEAPRRRPDARLAADGATWKRLQARDGGGLDAFRRGRLHVRGNLHLAVALLAAGGPLRFFDVPSDVGPLSAVEGGEGPPVLLLHGLGASKLSLITTLAELGSAGHRAIALDLPGFGDSAKPLRGGYHAKWFADRLTTALDALEVDRADVVGNSMGGRIALELGLRHPDRVRRLGLLCPSLAWHKRPSWAAALPLLRPELGAIQPAPRAIVDPIVRRLVPESRDGWAAVGVDEFLRGYLTPRGRVAFYAAARQIVLEDPAKFWDRLTQLDVPSLFVWGRRDQLVPIAFARHVEEALPRAQHLELDCGHVPQFEAPGATHRALKRFLA